MTAFEDRVSAFREACEHEWNRVSFRLDTPLQGKVIYVCEKCDVFTYRIVTFVGYKLESLEDRMETDPALGWRSAGGR